MAPQEQGLRRAEPREVRDRSHLRHPDLQALFDFWQVRAREGVVARDDVDVLDLRRWLGWLILIEAADDGFLCRVHGTSLALRFGHDMTGKPVFQHLAPAQRDRAIAEYRRVVTTGRPLAVTIEEREGSRWVRWEKLMLPLWAAGGGVHQILAGLYPFDAELRPASRLPGTGGR